MTRALSRIFSFLLFCTAVSAAARTTAVGPIVGATLGLSANEVELRLPLILSRALKKITLKNAASTRFIFPNEFAAFLKKREIEAKAVYTLPEYEKLRGDVDAGGIVTIELLPSETSATARLNYFDYSTYAVTSAIVSA